MKQIKAWAEFRMASVRSAMVSDERSTREHAVQRRGIAVFLSARSER
jgi:hypothetical protein